MQSSYPGVEGIASTLLLNPSGGYVGIGTTSPSFLLDVNGTGRFSGDLSVISAGTTSVLFDGTNPTLTLRRNNNGNASAAINFKGSIAVKWQMGTNQAVGLGFEINEGDATANRFYLAPGGAATFSSSVTATSFNGTTNNIFTAGGIEYMRLTGAGNLLLGSTSDTSERLQVTGSIKASNTITSLSAIFGTYFGPTTSTASNPGFRVSVGTGIFDPGGANIIGFSTNSTERLRITSTGAAEFSSTIKTAAPSGGTAKPFKIGAAASVSPTSPNRTIEIEIDGTTYYLSAKTTND
jgi:hypothetical protein